MRLIHILWGIDFYALTAKLQSIASFVAFLVTTFSVIANLVPKSERFVGEKAKTAIRWTHSIVSFFAINWRLTAPEKKQ